MASPVDPNQVILTGENSFLRLFVEQDGPELTRASHWRVLWSPGGMGHVLFLKSDAADDEIRLYADNISLARWLQEDIESQPPYKDQDIPVLEAVFSKSGDGTSFWTETVETEEETISLTWYDFVEPFMVRSEPGSSPGRIYGAYSCFIPARRAQITVNGIVASGRPFPDLFDGRTSSTAVLAWSETWVKPY